jgi:peptidoglycan/xylan/chitin deacetylase (PgdA/CDA1 family)
MRSAARPPHIPRDSSIEPARHPHRLLRIPPDADFRLAGEHQKAISLLLRASPEIDMRNRLTWSAALLICASALAPAGAASEPPAAAGSAATGIPLPILAYHQIRARTNQSTEATRLTVTPRNFARQMQCLAANGYHSISLTELTAYLREGRPLPARPVVLTFDDAWREQYDEALPVLRKSGFTATFFVVTDYVGHPGFMSWEQLRRLARAGMSIGSHSHSHADLVQVTDDNLLRDELVLSKAIIERKTGRKAEVFAYPYGSYDDRTIAAVERAGYVAARADRPGSVQMRSDLFALGAVNAPNDLADFEKVLSAPGICAKRR